MNTTVAPLQPQLQQMLVEETLCMLEARCSGLLHTTADMGGGPAGHIQHNTGAGNALRSGYAVLPVVGGCSVDCAGDLVPPMGLEAAA